MQSVQANELLFQTHEQLLRTPQVRPIPMTPSPPPPSVTAIPVPVWPASYPLPRHPINVNGVALTPQGVLKLKNAACDQDFR